MSPAQRMTFDRLCGKEGERYDSEDVDLPSDEDDDNLVSLVSSCFGGSNGSNQ